MTFARGVTAVNAAVRSAATEAGASDAVRTLRLMNALRAMG